MLVSYYKRYFMNFEKNNMENLDSLALVLHHQTYLFYEV